LRLRLRANDTRQIQDGNAGLAKTPLQDGCIIPDVTPFCFLALQLPEIIEEKNAKKATLYLTRDRHGST
jgi:hypothetical protein